MSDLVRTLFGKLLDELVAVVLAYASARLVQRVQSRRAIGPEITFEPPLLFLRRGQIILVSGTIGLFSLYAWREWVGPQLALAYPRTGIETTILGRRWITYEPISFDPTMPTKPDPEAVARELGWIRSAGFDGIITFTTDRRLVDVARQAKQSSLAVIMGVWNPNDQQEVAAAIHARDFVDAFAVGHNGLGQRYSYDDLVRAMGRIASRTGRPVSTTELLSDYEVHSRLRQLGDWLFPDVHPSDLDPLAPNSAEVAAGHIFDAARRIASQADRGPRPLLLKMITFPAAYRGHDVRRAQKAFFARVLDSRRNANARLPRSIGVSVHGAFDAAWKRSHEWPYYDWGSHTGLLESDGRARPAVAEIVRRLP